MERRHTAEEAIDGVIACKHALELQLVLWSQWRQRGLTWRGRAGQGHACMLAGDGCDALDGG